MRFTYVVSILSTSIVACGEPAPGTDAASPPIDAGSDGSMDAGPVAFDGGSDAGEMEVDAGMPHPGFRTPTATTRANEVVAGAWTDVGPADWTCLGTLSDDEPSAQAIALSGVVRDFQTDSPIGAATITAFPGIDANGNAGQATTSVGGEYSMNVTTLPAGTTRFGLKIDWPAGPVNYVLDQYLDPSVASQTRDLVAMSTATTTAFPAFIGVTWRSSTALFVGTLRDCQGRAVSNAVATVSRVSGSVAHLPGAQTFYFSAGASSLPVRENIAPATNLDGLFLVLDLAPQGSPAFVQVWGFATDADLAAGTMTLLSELAIPVEADIVMNAPLEPLRL